MFPNQESRFSNKTQSPIKIMNSMDLKTFVSESLKEIVGGVEEAQKNCHNAIISPSWS